MIADTSPLGPIGPNSTPSSISNVPPLLKLQTDQQDDRLGNFFSSLAWVDRQILALHFAERLSVWEIHVVLNLSMSDVLCRIQRLRRMARQSLQTAQRTSQPQLKLH